MTRASASAIASSGADSPYWSSRKASHTGRASSNATAARSSSRRRATTSSPSLKPHSRSQRVGEASFGAAPANTVTTSALRDETIHCPHANTASSRCGETKSRTPEFFIGPDSSLDAMSGGRVDGLSMRRLDVEREELDAHSADVDRERSHRHGQSESARAGAAGIDVQHAVTSFALWPMRMAGNDDVEPVFRRVDAASCDVVNHENVHAADVEALGFAQPRRPRAAIVVAAHGGHRRDHRKLGENRRLADVARMHDEMAAFEHRHCLGAQQPVRVGDQADPDRRGCVVWRRVEAGSHVAKRLWNTRRNVFRSDAKRNWRFPGGPATRRLWRGVLATSATALYRSPR